MKQRNLSRIPISLLVILTLVISLSVSVFADEGRSSKQQGGMEAAPEELLQEVEIPDTDSYSFTDKQSRRKILKEASEYPEKYDLRELGLVTPVKLQNPFGSCWAFAAIATAETSLISSGLADKDINLSERHLSYFTSTPVKDPDSSQYGEGRIDKGMSPSEKLDQGGYSFLASTVLASGVGPVEEGDDPDLIYKGRNGWIDKRFFDGKLQDYSYSATDEWGIPDEKRMLSDYALQESYVLPSPVIIDENHQYQYDPAATAAIKKQIMAGRAVDIGFLADQASPNQTEVQPMFLSPDWAHYSDAVGIANHAVTIVGWDDTIGSEESGVKFLENRQPQGYGAWLVKNSWGSGEEAFPNHGDGNWGIRIPKTDEEGNVVLDENGEPVMIGSGYFWLSYYDHSLCYPEALSFEEAKEGTILDAYDYMPALELSAKEYDDVRSMANIFKARENQQLEEIAFQTTHPNTTVNYKVTLIAGENTNLEAGYVACEGTMTCEFGGFHRIALEKPVPILSGQRYAIIITETVKDENGNTKYTVNLPVADKNTTVGVVNEDESEILIDGAWNELVYNWQELMPANEDEGDPVFDDEPSYAYDNFSIKGYSRPLNMNFSISVSGDDKLYHNLKESANLTVRETVKGEVPENMHIEWSVRDKDYIDLEPSEEGFSCRISIHKSEKEGEYVNDGTLLFLDVYDGETMIGRLPHEVSVNRPYIEALEPKHPTDGNRNVVAVYTGKEIRPEVEVSDIVGHPLVQDRDYEISYSDNIKCGVVKVEAIAKGATNPNSQAWWFFAIKPFKAELQKAAAGAGKITLTVKDQKETGITGYAVQYREKGTTKWTTKMVSGTGTKVTVSDIPAGKKYEVRVCGYVRIPEYLDYYGYVDEFYYGDFSAVKEVSVTTPGKAAVKSLKAGKKQLTVNVTKQQGVSGYQIQYRVKGTSKWTSKTLKGTKTKLVLKKLKAGKKYQVRARAFVKVGSKTVYGAYSKVKTGKKIK